MHQQTRQQTLRSTFLSAVTLATPEARLGVWLTLSLAIYFVPYRWLENLSLLKFLGWESAPSIGLTRAYRLLLHGQLDEAWAMNPLIVVVLVIGVPLLTADFIKVTRNLRLHRQ